MNSLYIILDSFRIEETDIGELPEEEDEDEESVEQLKNGDALMTKITGMGCSATAILAAFIAVIPNNSNNSLGKFLKNSAKKLIVFVPKEQKDKLKKEHQNISLVENYK